MKKELMVLIMLLGAALAFNLGASPSNAQTAGEYAATINGAGALDGGAQGMENYKNSTDFRPSQDYEQGSDYRTNLDISGPSAGSTDYATSDFSNATDYASPVYPQDNFGNATDYGTDNNYSNPTDLPAPAN